MGLANENRGGDQAHDRQQKLEHAEDRDLRAIGVEVVTRQLAQRADRDSAGGKREDE